MDAQQQRIAELEAHIEQLEKENQRLSRLSLRLQEKLDAALDGNGLCLWEQHVPTGRLKIFNVAWGKMLGYTPTEVKADVATWKSKLHPSDRPYVLRALEDHLAGRTDSYEVVHRMLHKDGSDSWVSDRGRVVEYDPQGRPLRMMGTHIDITREKRYEQHLATLATTDPLTGLLNRSGIGDAFDQLLGSVHFNGAALLLLDLDGFKQINDTYGHQTGDLLLKHASEVISSLAPNTTKLARLGGDEFVLLFDTASVNRLADFATQLLSAFKTPFLLEHQSITMGSSIGIYCFTQSQIRFEHCYDNADKAMYRVKRNGKNNFAFWQPDDTGDEKAG